eukprot:4903365-Amphidinium_carterae.3
MAPLRGQVEAARRSGEAGKGGFRHNWHPRASVTTSFLLDMVPEGAWLLARLPIAHLMATRGASHVHSTAQA